MYGRLTGDWSHLGAAWTNMETYMIPSHADQPSNAGYNPVKPATYAPEWEFPSLYPAQLNTSAPVGTDPLSAELNTTYGTSDLYGMHWLLDVDNWYGFGRQEDGVTRPVLHQHFSARQTGIRVGNRAATLLGRAPLGRAQWLLWICSPAAPPTRPNGNTRRLPTRMRGRSRPFIGPRPGPMRKAVPAS